jgi:hypothetical protein
MVVLSKPITDSFSGTASLTERPAESMPNADASFAAKTALGGRRVVRSSRATECAVASV